MKRSVISLQDMLFIMLSFISYTSTKMIKETIKQLKETYKALYNTNIMDYLPRDKLIEASEKWLKTKAGKQFTLDYFQETGDHLTSDRELVTLAIVKYLEIEEKPKYKYIIK